MCQQSDANLSSSDRYKDDVTLFELVYVLSRLCVNFDPNISNGAANDPSGGRLRGAVRNDSPPLERREKPRDV